MNILAFDIGASSGRAIIGKYDGDKLTLEEVHRFTNGTTKIRGHLYWNITHLYSELQTGIKKAQEVCEITSFGIDTWGVDGAFIGANDTLLALPYGYREFSPENMEECINEFGAAELYNQTGIQFLPYNTIFQLYKHKKEDNPLLKIAEKFLFIPDYLRFLLTGEKHTEYTIASTGQLLDPHTRNWNPDLFEKIGVPQELMGKIVESGTFCGTIDGTNIKAIAVAGHDTGSAVVSVPADSSSDNWAWMSSGTWSIMGIETKEPIVSEGGFADNFSNEGGAYGTIRFCKNIMGMWLEQECRRIWSEEGKEYSFDEMEEMVKSTPPNGPIIDTRDLRFMLPDNMIEEIQAVCRETNQKVPETVGEILRCVYESLAAAYKQTLDEIISVSGKKIDKLHIVGGGSQNEMLNQMTADLCGITIETGPIEGTAIGNLLVQLIANGELKDMNEARHLVKKSFTTKVYKVT